jgi:glycogen synthase
LSEPAKKLLLIGPWPPPHGGISVHLEAAWRRASDGGATCRVIDTAAPARGPAGPAGPAARWRRLAALLGAIRQVGREGRGRGEWTAHFHTTGHSHRSWLLALLCGMAAGKAGERRITLHSGLAPAFLAARSRPRRLLARQALARYDRVICVSLPIRDAVAGLGIAPERLELATPWLGLAAPQEELPARWQAWARDHCPLLVTALFHRPEYGFEVLLAALPRLADRYPRLGCLVLGGGEGLAESRRRIARLGLAERTCLAGDLPHALCLALIARSDLLVRPTLADGDSLVVREALALGVPVVASDASPRPPGTRLFRTGDAVDLAASIAAALEAGRPAGRPGAAEAASC